MGKVRAKKKSNRPTPCGISASKTEEKLESELDSNINSLLDQLQGSDAEERLCGLRRLSEIFFDEGRSGDNSENIVSRDQKQKFIRTASPFLIDLRSDIRNAAAGALRNVSVAGGPSICDIMVEDDVLTPLFALIGKYQQWCKSAASDEHHLVPADQEEIDTLLQAVHLLWNLCESSDIAVQRFSDTLQCTLNDSFLLIILLRFLDPSTAGIQIAVTVGQCLHTLSEDNERLLNKLRLYEVDYFIKYLNLKNNNKDKQHEYLQLNVLAAGLLVNLHKGVPLNCLQNIFDVLCKIVKIDTRAEICDLSSKVPLDNDGVLSSDSVSKLEKLLVFIESQTTAFEILTNICSSEEEESMDLESNESGDGYSSEGELFCNGEEDCSFPGPGISSDVLEAVVKLNFLEYSFSKTADLPVNVVEILNNHLDTKCVVRKFQRLRSRTFHFINNLLSVLDSEDTSIAGQVSILWSQIATTIVTTNLDNEELTEAMTAALRATARHLVHLKQPSLQNITENELQALFSILQFCKNNLSICANIIQISAILGTFFSKQKLNNLVKFIGGFLLNVVTHQQCSLCIMAEALDALMDVFAEDDTDLVMQDLQLVSALESVAPLYKKKVRKEHRMLGEYGPLVTTANMNLPRFIRYKKNRTLQPTK